MASPVEVIFATRVALQAANWLWMLIAVSRTPRMGNDTFAILNSPASMTA